MKRVSRLYIAQLLLLGMLSTAVSAQKKNLTLVFAGNMPDIGVHTYGTYSGLAGLLEKMRTESTPNIFVFAGGSLGPSPLSSLDRGSHIIDILNTLEPDLMTLTKREFSYFEDELTLRSFEAAFPIVSTNLYDPLIDGNLEGILSSLIVEKGDTKVGFISILDEEVVEEYLLKRAQVFEPRQVIQQKITELNRQGAELIVLVYAKDREYYSALISENKIDFALQVLPRADTNLDQNLPAKVYSIANQDPFMVLEITWDSQSKSKNVMINTPEIYYSFQSSQHTTSRLVDEYNLRLNRLLNQKIGFFGDPINTARKLVRTVEMPFGNFVADALKQYAQTDIALINGGVIRGDKSYSKGSVITRRDISTELPFRTHLAVISATGKELKQALENSVSEVELEKGRFLQVSGVTFSYSISRPAGQRLLNVEVKGQTLDLNKRYSIATSDYLASGGDGYQMFAGSPQQDNSKYKPPLLSDIVIRVIQQQKIVAPQVESRIVRVSQ